MEQIRCPKCKERHWVCGEALACLEAPDLRLKVAALEAELSELRLRVEPVVKVDRRAYMRDYMRKRRKNATPGPGV